MNTCIPFAMLTFFNHDLFLDSFSFRLLKYIDLQYVVNSSSIVLIVLYFILIIRKGPKRTTTTTRPNQTSIHKHLINRSQSSQRST